ncbi:two-component sensor histidine kinase [Flavimobilis marinus]|uniref:sensor histidine kinase n=1 Tax=Flavimobilis marinus TaxID=285351 RepID=UPI000B814A57|nr:histidine kinase [Flavimobilis marinus]GHG56381.1 two-component sensor histidine kinase [Flavimobilis marinus]
MIDLRVAAAAWRRSHVVVRDLPLALLIAGAPWIGPLQEQGTRLGDAPQRPLDALALVPIALQALPLAARRRWPAISLGLVAIGFAVDQLTGYVTAAGIALPIALVSAGAHLAHHRRAVVVGLSAGYVALALALERDGSGEDAGGVVAFYLVLAAAWCVGVWLRRTRAAEAERRRQVAVTTRLTERTRIARDLHDVVTHHVTAMVVQAEAARYLTSKPDRLDESLTAVADTGRRAISDLRQVLDLLDPAADAHDGAREGAALRELVEGTRLAGQPVEYVEEGDPHRASDDVATAAYRVVQEGLTNALKHAPGQRTTVHVRYGRDTVTVEVATQGDGPSAAHATPSAPGGGRGLTGLKERVVALGGELSAGREDGGAFVVRARIPWGGAS